MSEPLDIKLPDDFYSRYWQREPLLMRQALTHQYAVLSPDELAGLAGFEEVESRIVLERGGLSPWEVRHGPFNAADFAVLPPSHWTLLVQAVDHWDPLCAALRRAFPALPNWRLDDVMVSYATDGGGVGPHVDQYDVLLVQTVGRRRWRLGGRVPSDPELQEDLELPVLRNFDSCFDAVLEPGDVLYLPPGEAHWGSAEGECMTYSIGFRAPSYGEIIEGFAAYLADQHGPHERLRDSQSTSTIAVHPGEITSAVVQELTAIVRDHFSDVELGQWFGCHVTETKYPREPFSVESDERARLLRDPCAYRARADSRFAFQREGGQLSLFADGRRFSCAHDALALVQRLCNGENLVAADAAQHPALLDELLCCGAIAYDGDRDD